MPKTYTQTVNAARMFNIVPSVDIAAGTMRLSTGYVVGAVDVQGQFKAIPDAGTSAIASVTVPLTMSLAEANLQLQMAVAQQEDLDITQSVQSVTVVSGGSGYIAPTVAFSAPQTPGGTTAQGTVVLTGDVVTAVTVTAGGSGYLVPPAVTISDNAGSGAVCAPVMLVGDRVLAPTS